MMQLRAPHAADWAEFFRLARDEGWRIPLIEQRLFREQWSQSARMLDNEGQFCGLVTAVCHQRSGWIGNLLVPPQLRGRGYGSRLFKLGLAALEQRRVESIWLTASEQGRSLYERAGFVAVDEVERHVRPGGAVAPPAVDGRVVGFDAGAALRRHDYSAWGETRQALLGQLLGQGQAFAVEDAAALLQRGDDLQIVGPWYSPASCAQTNRRLLAAVVAAANPAVELVADVRVGSTVRQIFADAGFTACSRTTLMVRGEVAGVDLAPLVTFASLGSVG